MMIYCLVICAFLGFDFHENIENVQGSGVLIVSSMWVMDIKTDSVQRLQKEMFLSDEREVSGYK